MLARPTEGAPWYAATQEQDDAEQAWATVSNPLRVRGTRAQMLLSAVLVEHGSSAGPGAGT